MGSFNGKIRNILIVLILALVGSFVFCIIIDPYSVFHYDNIVCHSGGPNSRYVKIKYIVNNPDKFNSFIFGSSRVGYIHMDKINDSDNSWYNMTYSNAGIEDSLYSLKIMISNGVVPKNVMVGIDGVDSNDPFRFDGDLLRTQYPDTFLRKISFYKLYLNPSVSMEALLTLDWKNDEEAQTIREQYYEKGYEIVTGTPNYTYNKNKLQVPVPRTEMDNTVSDSLDVVKELIDICDEYDINLILFTTPIHYSYYTNEVGNGYILYIREIAKIHDIYCFAGLNEVCMNDKYYWEEVHFTDEVGDAIMDVIFYDKQVTGFGSEVLLTKENADSYFTFALDEYTNILQNDR